MYDFYTHFLQASPSFESIYIYIEINKFISISTSSYVKFKIMLRCDILDDRNTKNFFVVFDNIRYPTT